MALAIAPKPQPLSTEEFFSRDRDKIMEASVLSRHGKSYYLYPKDSLKAVADCMDFKVVSRFCPRSYTDQWKREIIISTLAHTEAAFNWETAVQVAHIRLHLFSGVSRPEPRHIKEAEHYARVFLAKEHDFKRSIKSHACIQWLSAHYCLPVEQVYLRIAELGLKPTRRLPHGTAKKPAKANSRKSKACQV